MSNCIKAELYDNNEAGYSGFICFIASNQTSLRVRKGKRLIRGWLEIEKLYTRYEPTSVKTICLETWKNTEDPETVQEGTSVPCFINPDMPAAALIYGRNSCEALGASCFQGVVATQYGNYTLLAESLA